MRCGHACQDEVRDRVGNNEPTSQDYDDIKAGIDKCAQNSIKSIPILLGKFRQALSKAK